MASRHRAAYSLVHPLSICGTSTEWRLRESNRRQCAKWCERSWTAINEFDIEVAVETDFSWKIRRGLPTSLAYVAIMRIKPVEQSRNMGHECSMA